MKVILAVSGTDKYFGMPKYFYLLANQLSNLGVDVELVIDSNRTDIVKEYTDVKVTCLQPLVKDSVSTLQFCWNLNRYLLKQKFDLLHTCHVLPYFYLMNKQRRKVVFQPFGNELFTLENKGLGKLHCKIAQPILRYCGHNADVLLAEGQFQLSEMVGYYDNESRMQVLPVAIDTTKFKLSQPYSPRLFSVLAVNSLTKYDGIDLLIDGFRLFYKDTQAHLTIIGSGEMEDELKKRAMGLPAVFLKNIPESMLIDYYASVDVYVSTTSETDMQMGVLEAMASGLPIISTNGDMINGNGFAVDPMPESISSALHKVYCAKREELGRKSLELVRQFDFANVAKEALKIYEGIC